jgi:predicted acylesterase/phospholipase RssA
LKQLREKGATRSIAHTLRWILQKNLYGISNPALYEMSYSGTKYLIQKFQNEILKCLHLIHDDPQLSIAEKVKFFSQTSHSYGQTALLLSGGGSLGWYHIGVVKALKKQNLLPKIIWGSSAGSIFASLIACRKYDELDELFNPYALEYECFEYKEKIMFMKIARFLKDGVIMDIEYLQKFLKKYLGNLTFEEAYDKTGWILNVSVSSIHERDVARLLNYVTSPDVLIWSAVSASCAIPFVFKSVELLWKNSEGKIVPYTATKNHTFIDGSVTVDLPMQRLSEIFNVNTFIVSQVNPFVIPFMNDEGGGILGHQNSFVKKFKTVVGNEIIHWINQLSSLGVIPDKLRTVIGLINQTYQGNVTISPQVKISDYWNLLRNPTPTFIK